MPTYYVKAADLDDGTIHTSRAWNAPCTWDGTVVPITTIEEACGSDYSGNECTLANHEWLMAQDELRDVLVPLTGHHGAYGVAYRGAGPEYAPDALRPLLAGLRVHPILDEEQCSEVEQRLVDSAWADFGARDFRDALIDACTTHDDTADITQLEAATESDLLTLWSRWCDAHNVNGGTGYQIETGAIVHFHLDELMSRLTDDDRLDALTGQWEA